MDTSSFPNGRKLFYFYPLGNFHKKLVHNLIEAEYEIYTLSNHRKGLPLMFQHNGAVIFFNIEVHAGDSYILALMRDFCRQSSQRSIQLYFLTRNEEQLEALSHLSESFDNCTPLHLPQEVEAAQEKLRKELEGMSIRGQRHYVRFGSNSDIIASLNFERRGKRGTGIVHDISSAGLSFSLPGGESMPLRSRLKEVAVDIGDGIKGLSGTVTIRRRQPNDTLLYILMFDKEMEQERKRRIRTAIHQMLQRQFTQRLEQVAIPE